MSDIIVEKITNEELMREACEFTMGNKVKSSISLETMYKVEHSPMRTQLFIIRMYSIPTFVSVHFVRHSLGITHFVGTNRDDRGGGENVDRDTPVDHMMLLNAEALVNLSKKRLCFKSHADTTKVMMDIKDGVALWDEDLAKRMVPQCIYRRGCHELKSCGFYRGLN